MVPTSPRPRVRHPGCSATFRPASSRTVDSQVSERAIQRTDFRRRVVRRGVFRPVSTPPVAPGNSASAVTSLSSKSTSHPSTCASSSGSAGVLAAAFGVFLACFGPRARVTRFAGARDVFAMRPGKYGCGPHPRHRPLVLQARPFHRELVTASDRPSAVAMIVIITAYDDERARARVEAIEPILLC